MTVTGSPRTHPKTLPHTSKRKHEEMKFTEIRRVRSGRFEHWALNELRSVRGARFYIWNLHDREPAKLLKSGARSDSRLRACACGESAKKQLSWEKIRKLAIERARAVTIGGCSHVRAGENGTRSHRRADQRCSNGFCLFVVGFFSGPKLKFD